MPTASLLDNLVALKLWNAAKEMFAAFVRPSLPWKVPADVVMALLVSGVFLVVAGTVFASRGRGKFWMVIGIAAGAALAGWVVFGGSSEVALFFVVILLVLKFMGGVTFILGILRSLWIIGVILAAVMLAATGVVEAAILGQAIGLLASFLGALSLFKKAEEFSPGRKGSRWNRRTSVGWVVCLLAAAVLEPNGLGRYGTEFKLAGMAVGLGIALMVPGLFGRGGVKVGLKKR